MNRINLDWFSFWSGIVPDQTAITILDDQASYSYGSINDKGQSIASYLYHEHGIRSGDRIGILSKNCIENIYLFAAAQKLGVILVPYNYRLTQYELSHLIDDSEPSILFYDCEFSVDDVACETIEMSQLGRIQSTTLLPTASLSPEDAIFILYTSGSTGVPKGVVYTHRMMYWNSLNTSVSLGINTDSCALVCMPPFHTGGWNVLLTPVLHHGGHVVMTEKFEAKQILKALAQYNCNQFMAVPTMLKMMADEAAFETLSLPALPYIIVGGEAMDISLIKIYEAKNISVRQGFGMTEAGPNLTSLHHSQSINKIGSIGKPNMYVNVKLIDESGNEVVTETEGELCFSGPIVMPAYWQNEDETKRAIADGWLLSGDIAKMDSEGYIYIKDRKKNMYISGGENVYPAEVERELLKHPEVSAVAIIGIKDVKWGEVGKAFVATRNPVSDGALKLFCSARLSKYKIPKHFVFLDALPVNSTGKIDRKELRRMSEQENGNPR